MTTPRRNATPPVRRSLRDILRASPRLADRWLWGARRRVRLSDAAYGTGLGGRLAELAGRTALIRVGDPIFAALALIELDGVARRVVLCPPDLSDDDLPYVIETAGIDVLVADKEPAPSLRRLDFALIGAPAAALAAEPTSTHDTEWVMFTSGTSGRPKMVVHSLAGLTGAIRPAAADEPPPIWGTFYDIRRYGGLQILLRGLVGEGSLVLTAPHEPMTRLLGRLSRRGATHITGTPSHWRAALMNPALRTLAPRYLRLSGEIADQAVLDTLKAAFPHVPVGHAYASTEAGVGFEVTDRLEGFPASFVGAGGAVEMKVEDGSLRIRSGRTASHYLGPDAPALIEADGFVDTGDMVERRGDRFYFVGRRNGVINVGGLKVHPEEVEAVINGHPAVRMSLVRGRRNPITGAIVVADVVLNEAEPVAGPAAAAIREQIMTACRARLAPFKSPASVRFVPSLAMTAGGKLERTFA